MSHPRPPRTPLLLLLAALCLGSPAAAQESGPPLRVDLNLGAGLLGGGAPDATLQPELGIRYLPGRWGLGVEAGFYRFDPAFDPDGYRAGFEDFTAVSGGRDRWGAFYLNAGPRLNLTHGLPARVSAGLDVALSYRRSPDQSVAFADPTGGDLADVPLALAEIQEGAETSAWTAALRPQLQLDLNPFPGNRVGLNLKAGVHYHLADQEVTWARRDLSEVRLTDNPFEMLSQFENAPLVQQVEQAPRTSVFASVGVSIALGGTPGRAAGAASGGDGIPACPIDRPYRCPNGSCVEAVRFCPITPGAAEPALEHLHEEGVIHRDVAARGAPQDGGAGGNTGEKAQDYNSSRSNKPRRGAAGRGGEGVGPVRWMAPEALRDGSVADPGAQGAILATVARLDVPPATPVLVGRVDAGASSDDASAPSGGPGGAPWIFRETRSYDLAPIRGTVDSAPEEKERGVPMRILDGATVSVGTLEPAEAAEAGPDRDTGSWHVELALAEDALGGRAPKELIGQVTVSVAGPGVGRLARLAAAAGPRGAAADAGFPDGLELEGVTVLERGSSNPLHQESAQEAENPLYEGAAGPGSDGGPGAGGVSIHLDLRILDPDDDGDGYGDPIRNLTVGLSVQRPGR